MTFGHYLESYFEEKRWTWITQTCTKQIWILLAKSFCTWSRVCCSPFCFFWDWIFVCFYWESNRAVVSSGCWSIIHSCLPVCQLVCWSRWFFPEWATSHTKMFTNQFVWYPYSWVTKWGSKTPFDLFRAGGSQSRDAADHGSTRHVNQFHHVISQCWPNFGGSRSTAFLLISAIPL